MFEIIEAEIENYLKNAGMELLSEVFNDVSFEEIDPENLNKWARGKVINAITTGGTHMTDNFETRQQVNISIIVISEEPKKMEERRQKAAQLVNSILSLLTYKTLGLPMQPLMPGRFSDITSAAISKIGVMAWQIDFTTDYTIDLLPEEPETILQGVDVTYNNGSGDNIDNPDLANNTIKKGYFAKRAAEKEGEDGL